jgi:hypothetical protein
MLTRSALVPGFVPNQNIIFSYLLFRHLAIFLLNISVLIEKSSGIAPEKQGVPGCAVPVVGCVVSPAGETRRRNSLAIKGNFGRE